MEIPIKMDDLEVPLFLETSSWISMGIIILSREWREIKGVQKPCGVVASSVFSPRKGDTHFPRNFHFGGYPFVKSILSVFLPGIQYLPLFCLEKNSGFWRLQPPKWRTNRFQEYIIYIYIPFSLGVLHTFHAPTKNLGEQLEYTEPVTHRTEVRSNSWIGVLRASNVASIISPLRWYPVVIWPRSCELAVWFPTPPRLGRKLQETAENLSYQQTQLA